MRIGDFLWAACFAAVAALFALPQTASPLLELTARHPYLLGFLKFAVLATMGELLVIRISAGRWKAPRGLWARVFVWGVVGVLVALMFPLFYAGILAVTAKGLLPTAQGWFGRFLAAFWASAIMNLTFGPVFMAAHRISDAWIDARFSGSEAGFGEIVGAIDWMRFLRFIVGRTIPFFWIPAHTITFLLPTEYRVLIAAMLSIVLGVILSWRRR